jgi:predicted DNA-binding protein
MMPTKNARISAIIDVELAQYLRRRSEAEGRSVSLVVRDILARFYAEEEERFWAEEGEERLETFDPATAIAHEKAWS